ncbi:SpoVK/Ycf46/Vps4 family AAA+-type ATPase [Sphaerotilus hippei]|uniref:SpoVK/Ycf46/Vps4 family AAA+-type ATPase n=1 Tax=Sphaerotilus hippei TaxID=744406 RepID=A0A318GWA4_9BURK|nr:ATP-binding protein [Sphaerotilus hippei]PXW93901.1 SpoVK/Ycf46/Vps4 family AAA+-type ATPase [Sphaerotilus hippei]
MPRRPRYTWLLRNAIKGREPVDGDADSPLLRLWLLRLLVPLYGHRQLILADDFSNEAVARAAGLQAWLPICLETFDPTAIRTHLRERHQAAETEAAQHPLLQRLPTILAGNVQRLGRLLSLTECESAVLVFLTQVHHNRLLDDACDLLGDLSSTRVEHALSVLLGNAPSEIGHALAREGILHRSGLVRLNRQGATNLRAKIELLSDSLADLMHSCAVDPMELLQDRVARCDPPQLALTDYPHLAPHLQILRPYLQQALNGGQRGVNVLLWGPPGTGKTQLARALAADLALPLFEVVSQDAEGDAIEGHTRLRAYRAAQTFLETRPALLAVDEMEDLFGVSMDMFNRARGKPKAWLNRALEINAVPTLWMSNSVDQLDPAFLRRFDLIIEMPIPPQDRRENILRSAGGDLLDAPRLARLASIEVLSPAVVARAAQVVRSVRDHLPGEQAPEAVERLIASTLKAQGHTHHAAAATHVGPAFCTEFLNADADMADVSRALALQPSARLCLAGPPGTGKSAYARWLASELGRPVLECRVSDLMSKWVGENERNVAAAFERADRDGAVLIIDEIDSFLGDRRHAEHEWESRLVNEMLVRIERFPGILVVTTNRLDHLDRAALRRFDLKVTFGPIRVHQAWTLLDRHCQLLGLPSPNEELRSRLGALSTLTPGDFSVVARQARFRPVTGPGAFVRALEYECRVKEGTKPSIGFTPGP